MLIKIDRDSIKKCENAGQTEFFVPGHTNYNEDGSITRLVSIVRTMTPVPNYSALYQETILECQFCHGKFSYKKLENDEELKNICPICSVEDCCEIEFEKFNNFTGK